MRVVITANPSIPRVLLTTKLLPSTIYNLCTRTANLNVRELFAHIYNEADNQTLLRDSFHVSECSSRTFRTLSWTTQVGILLSLKGLQSAVTFQVELCQPSDFSLTAWHEEWRRQTVDPIYLSIASIPSRVEMLRDVILHIAPQVDKVRVYLNEYPQVPEFLEKAAVTLGKRLEVRQSRVYGDVGDRGKFLWVGDDEANREQTLTHYYHFTVDDDIIYPLDYVPVMLNTLRRKYKNAAVLGVHCTWLKQPIRHSYYYPGDRYTVHFRNSLLIDQSANVLGTATTVFHSSSLKLQVRDFQSNNMADIWLTIALSRLSLPAICVQRREFWLVDVHTPSSIWDSSVRRHKSRANTASGATFALRKHGTLSIVAPPGQMKLVVSFITYNRVDYLRDAVESWLRTRNPAYQWVVIIADDGSTDGTHEYLNKLRLPHEVHILKNHRRYATGQMNSIFEVCRRIGFDVLFHVDDDLLFLRSGWDDLYVKAIAATGFGHLCFFHERHYVQLQLKVNASFVLPAPKVHPSGLAQAFAPVYDAMGQFFTFTPEVLRAIGGSDEENFPIRGQWHQDLSARCARAGFNDVAHFFDAAGSIDYLDMQNMRPNVTYRAAIPWGPEYKKTKEAAELRRRLSVVHNESRIYIPPPSPPPVSVCRSISCFFNRVLVINLDRRRDRWRATAAQLESLGVNATRFSAVDGGDPEVLRMFMEYNSSALLNIGEQGKVRSSYDFYLNWTTPLDRASYLEQKLRRKAIKTPGAYAYLLTWIKILSQAVDENWDSVLVLDDDACFHRETDLLFAMAVGELQERSQPWSVLQLGALQYNWNSKWITWHSQHLYKCRGSSVASHAVGVYHSAFLSLLESCQDMLLPFDDGPLSQTKHTFPETSFTIYPNIAIQSGSPSDISSSDVQYDIMKKAKNVYRWVLADYPCRIQ